MKLQSPERQVKSVARITRNQTCTAQIAPRASNVFKKVRRTTNVSKNVQRAAKILFLQHLEQISNCS